MVLEEDKADDVLPALEPEQLRLWALWRELHASRSSGMAVNPISYVEIEAFCRLTGEQLDPWEARAIRAVDDAYLAGLNAKREGTT